MGGRSKEKRKAAARERATAARRARTAPWTGTKQGKQVDFGEEEQLRETRAKRRAGGDGEIGGGTDRQRKFRPRPRER